MKTKKNSKNCHDFFTFKTNIFFSEDLSAFFSFNTQPLHHPWTLYSVVGSGVFKFIAMAEYFILV